MAKRIGGGTAGNKFRTSLGLPVFGAASLTLSMLFSSFVFPSSLCPSNRSQNDLPSWTGWGCDELR